MFRTVRIALALLTAQIGPASGPGVVGQLPCGSQVEKVLREWNASNEWLRGPPGIDGRSRFRISTDRLGVWITIEVPSKPRGPVRVFRTEAAGGHVVELDESCIPKKLELPGLTLSDLQVGFTDEHLERLLSAEDRLVVYLWSPHLPLSVEGYREITAAAGELGIPLAVVVDPSAVPAYVDEVSERSGIPFHARRPLAAVELLFRDLAIHAPSILFYWQGKAAAPLPGYRNRRAYVEFLEGVMARRD